MEFKVESLSGSVYQVIEGEHPYDSVLFQGSISDCEAFIRLKTNPDVKC